MAASISPEQNCDGHRIERDAVAGSLDQPRFGPCPPAPSSRPWALRARVRTVAVVRFPMAQSVPSTAIRGQVTSAMTTTEYPEFPFRTGLSDVQNFHAHRRSWPPANSLGRRSENSWRPFTMFIPRSIASSTRPRSCDDNMPLAGAIPKIK